MMRSLQTLIEKSFLFSISYYYSSLQVFTKEQNSHLIQVHIFRNQMKRFCSTFQEMGFMCTKITCAPNAPPVSSLMSRIEHSYKFCKFYDFSLNSTRYTKIRCLDDFSVRFYANRPASTGLRILQNLQNLRFFRYLYNFSIRHCEICDFLHIFVMKIPPTGADLRI